MTTKREPFGLGFRSFRDTVAERAAIDPEFREALAKEEIPVTGECGSDAAIHGEPQSIGADPKTIEREPGYYWVRFEGEVIPAAWVGGNWYLPGQHQAFPDDGNPKVTEVSRLVPP